MQSSAFKSRLSVFSLRCLPLHLTLTFSWLIPCLLFHSSCQANKRLFAFPWRLMPRPGRETECWEAGGKPVAGGYQKGRIDVCWLGPGGNSGWWNRWREVTCAAIKLCPVCLQHQRLLTPRPPLAQLSVCRASLPEQGSSHPRHTADKPNTQGTISVSIAKTLVGRGLKGLTTSFFISWKS